MNDKEENYPDPERHPNNLSVYNVENPNSTN